MRLAYADPPYPGQARRLYGCEEVDHAQLIARLCEYDGWALSTTSNALRDLLPLCPARTRVAAWVKPFAFLRPRIWPAYAWEPVIFLRPNRPCPRTRLTPKDWTMCNPNGVTARERWRGNQTRGQKPEAFTRWLLDVLDYRPDEDTVDDLFPGSGRVTEAIRQFPQRLALAPPAPPEGAPEP